MARFTRIEVAQVMKETGLVPLFYQQDINKSKKVLEAIYRGGARLMEFTNRGDFAHEVFNELNKFAIENMPDLVMGVGSVTDAGTASMYMQMGANFVVTPLFRKDIAIVCNRKKVLWAPGCGSLTEIAVAEELGCEIVKLFPGSVYKPGFIKSIKGPQPWTNVMPTGGVSADFDNLKGWFDAGAYCVGMGSKLIFKDEHGAYDYEGIEARTKQVLESIRKIRG